MLLHPYKSIRERLTKRPSGVIASKPLQIGVHFFFWEVLVMNKEEEETQNFYPFILSLEWTELLFSFHKFI